MGTLLLLLAVATLLWWVYSTRRSTGPSSARPEPEPPSAVAARHIADQLAAIDKELAAAARPGPSGFAKAKDAARTAYLDGALARLPIESVSVRGMGPKLHETLKSAGIRSVADLDKLASMRVEGIGEKARAALDEARSKFAAEFDHRFQKMSLEEMDAHSLGAISDAREDDATRERQRLRRVEALQRRRAELLRRAKEAELPEPKVAQVDEEARSIDEDDRRTGRVALRATGAGRRTPGQATCPRCGGALQQRRGRYGPFVGCSGFPGCRYTRNGTV